ncbi:MAG: EAL domain-containing protein [Pseudomonadota bacterium]|nr:EAL domain-containing protein [Pseudomonadota bacterium]
MVSTRDTLHLLMMMETQNDAEQLISLIRNAGFSTRAQSVSHYDQFEESLRAANWDVIVADPGLATLDFNELLNRVQRLNLDIPLILVPEESDPMLVESALMKGVAAVVPVDENNTLLASIRRELRDLRTRQEVRLLQVRLRDAEKRCRQLLESSRDPIAYIHDGMHVYANSAYLELFGYASGDELEGMPVMDMIAADSHGDFKAFLKQYQSALPEATELQTTGVLPDGSQFPMQISFTEATYADEPCTQVQIHRLDQQSDLSDELVELRNRDQLTSLFSKEYFLERLGRAIDHAVVEKEFSTLMYISLDQYDALVRSVGLQAADEVVKAVSQCLLDTAEQFDITARLGDDVLAWMMPGGDPEAAREHALRLLSLVNQQMIDLEQRTVQPTVSIGISMITDASPSPDATLQQAHLAADQVAENNPEDNGNGVHLFVPDGKSERRQTQNIQRVVEDALKGNRLKLVFQPLISMRGEEAEHYEVLLRLPIDEHHEMSAGEFIDSDDVSDLLKRKLDRWVILHATKLLSERQKAGKDTRLFINLTSPSLRDEGLPAWVQVALKAAGLKHSSIIFQVAEEDAVRFTAPAKRFCYQMHASGIQTAVTQFGCELSPIKLLKNVDFDFVKIDGSYSRDLNSNSGKSLRDLLSKVHEVGKVSVVPFVESAAAVSGIWQFGVHFIQGHYIQPPQAAMDYDFSEE